MAKQFDRLEQSHRDFILRQHVFFTASAAEGTRINLSPRSTDQFRIIDPNAVAYLDRTGSGNETAAHLLADGRLTIMMCAFDGPPMILRLYGQGSVLRHDTDAYRELLAANFDNDEPVGARQIVRLDVDLVQTSCGFGVPVFDYREERSSLTRWAEAKGPDGVAEYQREKNLHSMDGLPTGLFADP